MIVPEGESGDITFVGHTDQGGRGDGVQVMVNRGHAYIGTRVSRGVVVTDVRDPRNPESRLTSCRSIPIRCACICRPRTICCCASRNST